ncbi:isoprenoid biosynthesis glyoxalase ElbB [Candidatus Berkiella cookevillensis]|uniref:Glyoxalase n=1 Tax=Candidatus Berkiella cookevillensis TaxID=437022 RepID=A0A0Q9YS65_9GAMM|nr:isoprenoid biosynthesis glyoxalase ElbB [Candidatus Berkiella cookevillensis]MCS5709671.1 isoprenoid biosynthesis glyoxalase ElbB [Candidatus Berkiella cookevillensis]
MKKIAVVLSGCGVMDGSEIGEAILTLLAIDKAGAQYQCFAPNIDQVHVINHLTQTEMPEKRNVLVEAARIARGEIKDLKEITASDFDAVIFPGGFGAAKNLCDFAFEGTHCHVNEGVSQLVAAMHAAQKPVGFICIAPAMIPKLYPTQTKLTIGTDKPTADKLSAMGGQHIACPVTDIVVDKTHKVVSTPAYMLANRISEAQLGIEKLVTEILAMI